MNLTHTIEAYDNVCSEHNCVNVLLNTSCDSILLFMTCRTIYGQTAHQNNVYANVM